MKNVCPTDTADMLFLFYTKVSIVPRSVEAETRERCINRDQHVTHAVQHALPPRLMVQMRAQI